MAVWSASFTSPPGKLISEAKVKHKKEHRVEVAMALDAAATLAPGSQNGIQQVSLSVVELENGARQLVVVVTPDDA